MARVLIIEDDPDVRDLYRIALRAGGHEGVGFFETPGPALGRGPSPDVILLDEKLPGTSGLEWLGRLRERFPDARILVASVDAAALERAIELGADAVKLKPFPIGDLLEEIRALAPPRRRDSTS